MTTKNIAFGLVLIILFFSLDGFSQQNAHLINEKHLEDINQLVEDLSNKDKFSGTVIIAKDESIIFGKAIGIANKAQNSIIDLDTKFNLGSMNKMFTSIAISQLVEQKKLKFNDKVVEILPILPKNIYGKITVHHLLTHTAGTGDIFRNPKFWDIKDTAKNISTYLKICVDDPIWGKPGAKFEYSNYGYILLGAVIEKITGMSYYEYVRKYIFEVANMPNTDSYETDKPNSNMAIGYALPPQMPNQKPNQANEKLVREPNTKLIEVKGTSAGGGYSSANDLNLFSLALLTGKLISKTSLELITTGKIEVPTPPKPANISSDANQLPQRKYGYGFGESFENNVRIIGHNGGAPGVDAHFYIYPTLGYTVIVLSNYDRAGVPILNFIQNIITQNK